MCSSRADHSVNVERAALRNVTDDRSGANATGPSSCGSPSTHSVRSLSCGRVVHAGHEVPRDRAAVDASAVAGRPHPGRVARVVAGAVVDERDAVDLAAPAVDHDGAAHRHARLLAGPDVVAVAARRVRRSRRRRTPRASGRSARRRRRPARASPTRPPRRGRSSSSRAGCRPAPPPPTSAAAPGRCAHRPRTASGRRCSSRRSASA